MNEQEKAEKYLNASTRQLIWWRFKKHLLAMIGLWSIVLLYIAAILCEFLAPYGQDTRHIDFIYAAPSNVHLIDHEGRLRRPFVCTLKMKIDIQTQQIGYEEIAGTCHPIRFFVRGDRYSFWGLFESDLHLFGVEKPARIFLFGTDRMGRDMFSRCLYGSRISLSIGMVGVGLSLVLGLILGGVSGYVGGWTDGVIQRIIEIIRCFPSIPLWMGLAAAMPPHWPALKVYFAITVILSLIGWTDLARMVRGKLIALREEEFVLAARFAGASDAPNHLPAFAAVFYQSYYCDGDPGNSKHDIGRNGTEFSRHRTQATDHQPGRAPEGSSEPEYYRPESVAVDPGDLCYTDRPGV